MKFGIFYEHQLPRPWGPKSEYQLLQDSLTQIELADRLGYDYAWEVEHHFLEEYSHSSAPEVFLGAASQRTKRIRLGHGVIQLTTNQPHRVAEKVATLDLLSGGRVELGMGEAAGPAELHPFGIRVRDKRERWEEAVKAIVPMFTRDSWEFHGQYYDFPARNVIPKPMQKPHPPLWVACSNIATIGKAGEWGMGALGFTFVTPEAARAWVHKYYNNLLNNAQKLAAAMKNTFDNTSIDNISWWMGNFDEEEKSWYEEVYPKNDDMKDKSKQADAARDAEGGRVGAHRADDADDPGDRAPRERVLQLGDEEAGGARLAGEAEQRLAPHEVGARHHAGASCAHARRNSCGCLTRVGQRARTVDPRARTDGTRGVRPGRRRAAHAAERASRALTSGSAATCRRR